MDLSPEEPLPGAYDDEATEPDLAAALEPAAEPRARAAPKRKGPSAPKRKPRTAKRKALGAEEKGEEGRAKEAEEEVQEAGDAEGEPKKLTLRRPRSAYEIFVSTLVKDGKRPSMKAISVKWNGLTDVERKKMHDLAEAERKTLRGNFTTEVEKGSVTWGDMVTEILLNEAGRKGRAPIIPAESDDAKLGKALPSVASLFADAPSKPSQTAVATAQLQLDENGNVVLDEQSLTAATPLGALFSSIGSVQEVAQVAPVQAYSQAYKKGRGAKWAPEEIQAFYDALAMYGTDLMLIQTALPNKSTAQVRAKLKCEQRKNGDKVEEALSQKKALTRSAYEEKHGVIDVSKHWRPDAEHEQSSAAAPAPKRRRGEPALEAEKVSPAQARAEEASRAKKLDADLASLFA